MIDIDAQGLEHARTALTDDVAPLRQVPFFIPLQAHALQSLFNHFI